jgi:hypothetical protein
LKGRKKGIPNEYLVECRKSCGDRVCSHAVSVLVLRWSVAHQHDVCYWSSILRNCAVVLKNEVSTDLYFTETDVRIAADSKSQELLVLWF